MNSAVLDILVCPMCKGPLRYLPEQQELICKADRVAYPILDDIPVMLPEKARGLSLSEKEALDD